MPIQVISRIFCDTVFRGFGIDKRAQWTQLDVETGGAATGSTCPMPSRVYDRQTASETLKAVIALGYEIWKQ